MKYKVRLVDKGLKKKEGIDFTKVFSPVVKYKTVRIILFLVAQFDLELEQMDGKRAFLHGELDETLIFMEQQEGFKFQKWKNMACLFNRSLCRLEQSLRQ